jgi:CRP-like cAMP-binding protein
MTKASLLEEMKGCEFFRGFEDDQLRRLADISRIAEFPARTTVFEEFEKAREVYVILSGQISLAICEPADTCKQIGVVLPGELMGWSSLVGRPRLYDSAHTLTAVKALVFEGDKLMEFCAHNPSFGFKFMQRVACTLAERLSGTRMQLLEMCGVHLPDYRAESD